MDDTRKTRNLKIHALIAMIILLTSCFLQLHRLSRKITDLEYMVNICQNQVSSLQRRIDSIKSDTEQQLEEGASILSSLEYTLGTMDPDTKTAPVIITLIPKHITEGMTLSVQLGEENADFTRNGNEFTATLTVGMFIPYGQYPLLSIEASDGTKTELLEDVGISELYRWYLPSMGANISSVAKYRNGKLELDGTLDITLVNAYENSAAAFTKFELVTELNGEEIAQKDLLDCEETELYNDTVKESYEVSQEDTLCIYVVAEDSLGYIHKNLAYFWEGAYALNQAESILDDGEYIYDRDGNLLNEG